MIRLLALVFAALAWGCSHAGVPPQALPHLPTLSAEIQKVWPQAPSRAYFGALVEHESACTVSPRKCWNPAVQLRTQREQGVGLGQITRTWRQDGSLRFDKLAEMRASSPMLAELSWETIVRRPDLQLRTMIVMVKSSYRRFSQTQEPLWFADAAYNGGDGGVDKDRRACHLTAGCDPQRWFGHVERTCTKSRKALYGNRSACDINRHHVSDVRARAPKYRPYLGD